MRVSVRIDEEYPYSGGWHTVLVDHVSPSDVKKTIIDVVDKLLSDNAEVSMCDFKIKIVAKELGSDN